MARLTDRELEAALAALPAPEMPDGLLERVRADAVAVQARMAAEGRMGLRGQLRWALFGPAGIGGLVGLAAAGLVAGVVAPDLLGLRSDGLLELAPDLVSLVEG